MPEGLGAVPSPRHRPCEAKVVCERTKWGPRGGAAGPRGKSRWREPAGWSSGTCGVWHWLCDLGKLLHLSGPRLSFVRAPCSQGYGAMQCSPEPLRSYASVVHASTLL